MLVSKTILNTLWDCVNCTRWQVIAAAKPSFVCRTVHHYPHAIRENLAKQRLEAASVKEELPPLDIYGCMRDIKYSPRKLNMIAAQIRKLRIKDAIIQMEFSEKKGAKFIKQVLEETQDKAVKEYFVTDPENLFVQLSYVGKGQYLRDISYHGKGMHGIMHYGYAHYFLMLREGDPPVKVKKNPGNRTRELIMKGPRLIPNAL